MEARAPYHTAPTPPRNLAEPLAAWLRTQGFLVSEKYASDQATLMATWTGPRGERFGLSYLWSPRYEGTVLSLQVAYPGQTEVKILLAGQQVYCLQEARLLLTGNLAYANARTLAALPHPAL